MSIQLAVYKENICMFAQIKNPKFTKLSVQQNLNETGKYGDQKLAYRVKFQNEYNYRHLKKNQALIAC